MPDYEMWHALHNECGPYGCNDCVVIDLEFDDETRRLMEEAAAVTGEPVDVFIHRAVVEGMKHEGFSRRSH